MHENRRGECAHIMVGSLKAKGKREEGGSSKSGGTLLH